jgi:hypothetical protein
MLTAQMEDVLRTIKAGVPDAAVIQFLDQASSREILAELDSEYPVRIQERRLGNKWEVSLAHSVHYEIGSFTSGSSFFPVHFLIPVLRRCLFLSGEGDKVTGIGTGTRLIIRPVWKTFQGLALTIGRGRKLDKDLEGSWNIKEMERRKVKLSKEFLLKRGWRFDVLALLPMAGKDKGNGQ